MGKWSARLAEKTAAPLHPGTDETAKRGFLSVLAAGPGGGKEEISSVPKLPTPEQTCEDCAHRLRHGTCAVPAVAGLEPPPGLRPGTDWFSIRWPPDGHAQSCQAFEATAT